MIIFLIALAAAVQAKYVATLLTQNGTHIEHSLKWSGETKVKIYKNEINCCEELIFQARFENASRLDLQILDKEGKSFRMPNHPALDFDDVEHPALADNYAYNLSIELDPFVIRVLRSSSNETIFTVQDVLYAENYLEFTHIVPTKEIFGLGERNQVGFRFKEGFYTLMGRDEPNLKENGKRPGKHVYSSQPVLLQKEISANFNLFFYKTTSPIDVEYKDGKLKFVTIGGIMHFKLFLGNQMPISCVSMYHDYLRGWIIPPFWSLGYHQSRWGYKSGADLLKVILEHQKHRIPLDVIWTDLDYMHDKQIFSVNSTMFTSKQYHEIQTTGTRYVPLLDVAVGVKYGKKDHGYLTGHNLDIFLYSPQSGRRFKGKVWPGASHFPDFLHPNISQYWSEMHGHLYSQVQFDGIWLDMNEPANFCDGECNPESESAWKIALEFDPEIPSKKHRPLDLPYIPGDQPFETKTLPPNLIHYGDYLHKDIHNIYGHLDSYYTYEAQRKLGKIQVFQLTRSTFPGTGRFSQHWFGDNYADWDFLYLSLGQVFQFQIFGIPMTGADVCGFMGDTTEELCARWIQLGALYPFFRNHNHDQARPQEFYSLGKTVLETAKKNIYLRYSLLKWMYTLYYRANGKGTILSPLFFMYPADPKVYDDQVLDTELMLGDELLSTPILNQSTFRSAYFPEGDWYDFLTGMHIAGGGSHLLFRPFNDYVPLFLRSGYLVLQQTQKEIKNTRELTQNYRLVAALDKTYEAVGSFLDLDDFTNESRALTAKLLQIKVRVQVPQIMISITRENGEIPESRLIIDEVLIFGLNAEEVKSEVYEVKPGTYLYNTVITGPFNFGQGKLKEILVV